HVNFGAAKLTVYGQATIAELEAAGAFENIRVRPEQEQSPPKKTPFWRAYGTLVLAAVLAVGGFLFAWAAGENSPASVLAFAAAILIGGWELFAKGIKNLLRFQFDMNVLMTVAVFGAAAIGEWGEGAAVVVLFAVSEMLEDMSMEKARQS